MFGRIGTFIFGAVAGGLCVLGALRYHVVKAEDGFHFVPKMSATLSETYVDVRDFGPGDWTEHPTVTAAIVRDGKSHLIKGAAVDSLFGSVENMLQSM